MELSLPLFFHPLAAGSIGSLGEEVLQEGGPPSRAGNWTLV